MGRLHQVRHLAHRRPGRRLYQDRRYGSLYPDLPLAFCRKTFEGAG